MEFILFIVITLAVIIYLAKYQNKKNPNEYNKKIVNSFDNAVGNAIDITSHKLNLVKNNISKSSTLNYISNVNWIQTNSDGDDILYTFLNNSKLLITVNGIVQKCEFEIIVDNNSILITKNGISEMYNIVNMQDNLLYLYKISTKENLFFINQTKAKNKLIKEINIEIENQRKEELEYTYVVESNLAYFSFETNWKKYNSNKTYTDYVDYLEDKYKYPTYETSYEKFILYNPNLSRYEFGKFIFYKYEMNQNYKK